MRETGRREDNGPREGVGRELFTRVHVRPHVLGSGARLRFRRRHGGWQRGSGIGVVD